MEQPSREREIWAPEPLWQGATAFLLGGGDSLRGFDFASLRPFGKVVAINAALLSAPWADALFFGDWSFFKRYRGSVQKYKGLCVSSSRGAKRDAPGLVKRVALHPRAPLVTGANPIRQGRSAGQTAISFAAAIGADRIILLGFDMCFTDGRSHFHNEYKAEHDKLYSHDFLPAFKGWGQAAIHGRKEVLNASPDSALVEFPKVKLNELFPSLNPSGMLVV